MTTNPSKYGDAIRYDGGTIPIPAVMEGNFYTWAAKRYVSGIKLKICVLEKEIEINRQEIEIKSKINPPGTPGYKWVEELQSQNAKYNARIEALKDEITK